MAETTGENATTLSPGKFGDIQKNDPDQPSSWKQSNGPIVSK